MLEYNGLYGSVRCIMKTEGAHGLCKGLLPTLLRDVPFSGRLLDFKEFNHLSTTIIVFGSLYNFMSL